MRLFGTLNITISPSQKLTFTLRYFTKA